MPNPFVSGSYDLDSRPASVQRTVNLMPVPIEPGNEREGWVFKDVPGLVAVGQELVVVPSLLVDCDLLLHFDEESPSAWLDYSQYERALSVTQGVGTIIGADVGEFSRGARVTNPNAGTNADVAHPVVTAAGSINFGSSDFWISFYIDFLDGLPGASGNYFLVSNLSYDLTGGWYVQVSSNNLATQTTLEFGFVTASGSEVKHGNVDVTGLTGRHHIACSRSAGVLATYLDYTRYTETNTFSPVDQSIDNSSVPFIAVFSLLSEPGHRVAGLKGAMDELYVNHGDGTGINVASFTPPTIPFDSTHTLRQILGLDP